MGGMESTQIVTVVTTPRLAETRRFYVDLLGFEVTFEHPAYLGLRAGAAGAPEIGFMRPDDDAPEAFQGAGLWLSVVVADADAECARLRRAGVAIRDDLADMPWGCRRFTVVDPSGVVVMVNHPIPVAVDYQDCVQ